jgi:hypothetical protein
MIYSFASFVFTEQFINPDGSPYKRPKEENESPTPSKGRPTAAASLFSNIIASSSNHDASNADELFFDDPPLRISSGATLQSRQQSSLSSSHSLNSTNSNNSNSSASNANPATHTVLYGAQQQSDQYRLTLRFEVSKTLSCVYKKDRTSCADWQLIAEFPVSFLKSLLLLLLLFSFMS